MRRRIGHQADTIHGWFVPIAQQPSHLVTHASSVAGGCVALMVNGVAYGRALPLWWVVVCAPKGDFPEATHRARLAPLQQIIPANATLSLLGDGEVAGTDLQAELR